MESATRQAPKTVFQCTRTRLKFKVIFSKSKRNIKKFKNFTTCSETPCILNAKILPLTEKDDDDIFKRSIEWQICVDLFQYCIINYCIVLQINFSICKILSVLHIPNDAMLRANIQRQIRRTGNYLVSNDNYNKHKLSGDLMCW